MTVPYPANVPNYTYTPPAPMAKSKGLGTAAMIAAIVILVLSLVAAISVGLFEGPVIGEARGATDFNSAYSVGFNAAQSNPQLASVSLVSLLHILLGTLLGTTSLILGIIAAATKRGRAQGVVAIVIAGLAPFLSFAAYAISLQIGAATG
jgi:hypothetical protein